MRCPSVREAIIGQKLAHAQVNKARDLILKKQGNKCAICKVPFDQYTVKGRKRVLKNTPMLDHCHDHGYVRGVLCRQCNSVKRGPVILGEGAVLKSAKACSRDMTTWEWLRALADYWEKHSEPQTQYIHPEHKTDDEKRLERNARERARRARAKAAKLVRSTK